MTDSNRGCGAAENEAFRGRQRARVGGHGSRHEKQRPREVYGCPDCKL
jgi:hypothetical protein